MRNGRITGALLASAAAIIVAIAAGGPTHTESVRQLQTRASQNCTDVGVKDVRSNVVIRNGRVHALHHGQPFRSHRPGSCIPRKLLHGAGGPPQVAHGELGCDLSNNDPVYQGFYAIRANGLTYCYLKVVEGVNFHDQTASAMRYWADKAGVIVGGYDFGHVCLVGARTGAHFFAVELQADGVTGLSRLKPVLDAEYGGNGCDVHQWVNDWINQIGQEGYATVVIYTGPWWWTPHAGCWWPIGVPPWISGYPNATTPCGAPPIKVHQFTDHGDLGGGARGDENVLRGEPRDILNGPPPVVIPREVQSLKDQIVTLWDRRGSGHLSPADRKTYDADMNRIYFLGWRPHRSAPTHDWKFKPGPTELKKCALVRKKWAKNKHGTYVRRLIDELWESPAGSGGPHVRVHTYHEDTGCVRMPGNYKIHG